MNLLMINPFPADDQILADRPASHRRLRLGELHAVLGVVFFVVQRILPVVILVAKPSLLGRLDQLW